MDRPLGNKYYVLCRFDPVKFSDSFVNLFTACMETGERSGKSSSQPAHELTGRSVE
jgi:hypothetical protein